MHVITRNTINVLTDYQFDKQDKAMEIELIDSNIAIIKQKLKSGAATLQNSTISQLMTMLEKLILKKDFLENGLTIHQSDDATAWHLHQKAQSGFEKKANILE
ncbi:MAG: hypothetical protein U5M51_03735 [Emticicia sp.]|nr:hypothetical protein [Emticicia sp.]